MIAAIFLTLYKVFIERLWRSLKHEDIYLKDASFYQLPAAPNCPTRHLSAPLSSPGGT
jgi:hypothetical protein